jgi:hypothetical protein
MDNPSVFDGMFWHMSQIFSDVWGAPVTLKLHDGREIVVSGIYREYNIEWSIHDGVDQRMPWPKLDIRRADLIAAGVLDPEADLDQAELTLNGKTRMLSEIRDDQRVMVKCRVSDF